MKLQYPKYALEQCIVGLLNQKPALHSLAARSMAPSSSDSHVFPDYPGLPTYHIRDHSPRPSLTYCRCSKTKGGYFVDVGGSLLVFHQLRRVRLCRRRPPAQQGCLSRRL